MTKPSNFKLISLITYGIWGGILAFFSAMITTALISGFFWVFIFGDDTWPAWSGVLLQAIVVIVFLGIFSAFLTFGQKKAKLLIEMSDHNQARRKSRNAFLWSLVGLLLFSLLLNVQARSLRSQRKAAEERNLAVESIKESLLKIDQIQLSQEDKRFKIEVSIPGPSNDQYFLKVQIQSIGYVKGEIETFELVIVPEFGKQKYNFEISFKEMGDVYRKLAEDYVLSFDQKVGIDELISVDAELKLLQTDTYSSQYIESIGLTSEKQAELANFFFTCLDDNCLVTQIKPEEN